MSSAGAAESSAVSGAASGCWSCMKAIGRVAAKACGCLSACIRRMSTRTVSIVLRVVNLLNATFLAVACYFAYTIAQGNVTRFFLATYIGIFSLLLFAFETRFKYTEEPIRRNCGFMYTYTGRAALLIFLGAITFGMIDTSSSGNSGSTGFSVVVGAGVFTLLNSVFNCFVICSHPGFQELSRSAEEGFKAGAVAGGDPGKMSDEQIKAYLAQHPEVAAAALSSVQGQRTQPDLEAGAAWAQEKPSAAPAPEWTTGRGRDKKSDTAAYVPPAVALSPAAHVDTSTEANPFSFGQSTVAKSPARAPSPAPVARVPAPAPAPAPPAPTAVEEDNPFATDNPFDKPAF